MITFKGVWSLSVLPFDVCYTFRNGNGRKIKTGSKAQFHLTIYVLLMLRGKIKNPNVLESRGGSVLQVTSARTNISKLVLSQWLLE